MDTETTTPATDIVAVDEEEGFSQSDLTKLAITAAVTTVVIIGGRKVLRRATLKLAAYAEKHTAEAAVLIAENTETPAEDVA